MKRAYYYQLALIFLGLVAVIMFFAFLYREIFPEYKIYQNAYVALEKFHSSYTHEPPAPFKEGVKQILIESSQHGPETIDRCISCHVALEIEYFSPTILAKDINGKVELDQNGMPIKAPNPNYIWKKVEESGSETLKSLMTAHVGDKTYNVTKVLRMHPLIGKETRPFEFHPLEEYGCVSCHNGNGRALTVDKAHGPVFDEQYDIEFSGPERTFLEKDPENDPLFSKEFNHKPGSKLLFQTTPIFTGALIQSKCTHCHQMHPEEGNALFEKEKALYQKGLKDASKRGKEELLALNKLKEMIQRDGLDETLQNLKKAATDPLLNIEKVDALSSQEAYLTNLKKQNLSEKDILQFIEDKIKVLEGNDQLSDELLHVAKRDIDLLTKNYCQGQNLYISEACYACHKIAGFSRGGVGPELTKIGNSYPWYIKESIVWPQADLTFSTMPNYKLDHEELENLMTFLLAQVGETPALSGVAYKTAIQDWENGKLQSFEKPISPNEITHLDKGMMVFASEGCAACHRLRGFESNVGFVVEKEDKSEDLFKKVLDEKKWFQSLFYEEITGSQIVSLIENHKMEIDRRIVDHVREDALLERIEKTLDLTQFYSNFKFALRAKNHYYQELIKNQPQDKKRWERELHSWQSTVRKVLKVYIQEYGLGRLICPKLHWSGTYRSDEWLMEHFRNPSSHVPRSIMPVFPFDSTKFYLLTFMLDALAKKNNSEDRKVWETFGFKADEAYEKYCSQCHGIQLEGNGPVAEWLYPIPKNLKNADFLRNLTEEKVMDSITHGVKGTPMAPWGEVSKEKGITTPVLTSDEVKKIAQFLFEELQGGEVIRSSTDVPKWQYTPEKVVHELKKEKVDDYFDVVNLNDEKNYYIKKKFFTKENIEKGKEFFELNCAICHGKEGDGSGIRAQVMNEAKPRMFTNLDWLNSKDDLRLLSSIKYGVPGTAMTPWGDQTNALQRMQLVIFIRSLNEESEKKQKLFQAIYQVFEEEIIHFEKMRSKNDGKLQQLKLKKEALTKQRKELEWDNPKEAAQLYEKALSLNEEIKKLQNIDEQYVTLINLIKSDAKTAKELGSDILSKENMDDVFELFLKGLKSEDDLEEMEKLLDVKKDKLEKEKQTRNFGFTTSEKNNKISHLNSEINHLTQLKKNLMSFFNQSKISKEKKEQILNHLKKLESNE
jgi:mono/diheme cytochrome c family protein